jgi:hypothetical protein
MVIRRETPSGYLFVTDREKETGNGRVPQEDDRGLGRNADGLLMVSMCGSAAWPAAS